jgi:hypothetical protein
MRRGREAAKKGNRFPFVPCSLFHARLTKRARKRTICQAATATSAVSFVSSNPMARTACWSPARARSELGSVGGRRRLGSQGRPGRKPQSPPRRFAVFFTGNAAALGRFIAGRHCVARRFAAKACVDQSATRRSVGRGFIRCACGVGVKSAEAARAMSGDNRQVWRTPNPKRRVFFAQRNRQKCGGEASS